MPKRLAYDRTLFFTTLTLVTGGLLMVFSASALVAVEKAQSPYGFVARQGVGAVLGIGAMLLLMKFDYRRLKEPTVVYTLLGVTLVLLAAVLFLDRSHNTHRWIRLGPLSLQPSEMAKPVVILFLASFLAPRMEKINEGRTLGPVLATLGLVCALVYLGRDLGTTVTLALIAGAMLFVCGLEWKWLSAAAAGSAVLLYFFIVFVHYRAERIMAFLHPWREAQGAAYQVVQSLVAIGSGGWTGVGLMNSRQKLFFLPAAHTDFIFAVVGEEFGWIGCAVTVALFMVFLWRGLKVARRAPDDFGKLLAVGVTAMVVIQALINFSVATSLLPNKGIPLPFVSYGGSALIFALAAVGMLLSVSQHN